MPRLFTIYERPYSAQLRLPRSVAAGAARYKSNANRVALNVVQARKAASQKKQKRRALFATLGGVGVFGGAVLVSRVQESGADDDEALSQLGDGLRERLWGMFDRATALFVGPGREKLLPDFPTQQLPPGSVAPRTLVLDLEGTLTREEWSPKYGWRTAKRPGLDIFLRRMANVYEIVLFADGGFATTEPVAYQIDPFQCISHRLYRDSLRFVRGRYMKDLSQLNRDLRRVVAIDNDPLAMHLQQANAIIVKSFEHGATATAAAAAGAAAVAAAAAAAAATTETTTTTTTSTTSPGNAPEGAMAPNDGTLLDLVPFLEAIVDRDVADVRVFIERYKSIARKKRYLSTAPATTSPGAKSGAKVGGVDNVLSGDVTAAFRDDGSKAGPGQQSSRARGLGGVARSFRGQFGR